MTGISRMELLKNAAKSLLSAFFIINGKKPWSIGYNAYKEKQIEDALKNDSFGSAILHKGYGFRIDERIIEYPWFFSRLPDQAGSLLDAGSVLNYDYLLSNKIIRPKKLFISTLAPEKRSYWNKGISYVFEDLRRACFRDSFFDWIVSLSTIEHIGMDNTMLYTSDNSKKEYDPNAFLDAVNEFHRILKPGGTLYLSFPFGQKKNHGWFQVFDSTMVDKVITVFSPSTVLENHFRYEKDGWRPSSREESKNATCFDIHHQKTYDEDYAAFSRAIVCLEMVK